MTDSGGFQVFSLGQARVDGVGKVGQQKKASSPSLTKIDEEGVSFVSLKDGSRFHLTPEDSIKVQEDLGADIIFAFDECTSPLANRDYTEQSMQRTHRWADRCLQAHSRSDQLLFGIIQGGRYLDLRKESSQFIASRNFGGFGIGGAFGEKEMQDVLSTIICFLPEEKPRHLLGIGEVEDIIIGVEQGIDLFDCVTPTRLARRGVALTKKGKINLRSSSWRSNYDKLGDYSYSYLHHLVREKEIYGIMLLVEHNLRFMMNLMEDIREAIRTDSWSSLRSSYLG
jgi:queuine tRNA-ribosyltransferase